MKIRNGFVSNSSSSSFVVLIKKDTFYSKSLSWIATEEDIKKLEDFGFEPSNSVNPFNEYPKFTNKKNGCSMRYDITCNQEEVIKFLIKNNIPFNASCLYQNQFISFKKDSDYILKAINFGQIIAMYGEEHYDKFQEQQKKAVEKIPKRDYLE